LDRAVRARSESEAKKAEVCEAMEELAQTLEETRDRYRTCAQEVRLIVFADA